MEFGGGGCKKVLISIPPLEISKFLFPIGEGVGNKGCHKINVTQLVCIFKLDNLFSFNFKGVLKYSDLIKKLKDSCLC